MKTLKQRYNGCILALFLMLMFSPSAFCENSVTLTVQYDAYTDDDSPETTGTELSVPLHVEYAYGPFAITLQTAYSHAEVNQNDSEDFTLSGAVDTFISTSYMFTFPTRNPTKFILNLDVNLPSGEENLDAEQAIAESGLRGDLFRIDDFGEGLNVGGTLGLERQFGNSTIGLYGGYTYYGEYDPRSDETDDEYDPGDEIFGGMLYEWKGSPRNVLQLYAGYSYFDVDAVNAEDNFKIGDKVTAGTDIQAGLSNNLDMSMSLQYIFQFESEEMVNGSLEKESTNSNGDEIFGVLELTYQVHPRFSVQVLGDVRYYGESERERKDLGLPYEGRRLRYAGGSGFEYRVTPSFSVNGGGMYFYLENDPNASFAVSREFQGMNLDFGVKYTF